MPWPGELLELVRNLRRAMEGPGASGASIVKELQDILAVVPVAAAEAPRGSDPVPPQGTEAPGARAVGATAAARLAGLAAGLGQALGGSGRGARRAAGNGDNDDAGTTAVSASGADEVLAAAPSPLHVEGKVGVNGQSAHS